MDESTTRLKALRSNGVKINRRPDLFICFIDLRKAYDKVDRGLLVAKMLEAELDPTTIQWVAKWL